MASRPPRTRNSKPTASERAELLHRSKVIEEAPAPTINSLRGVKEKRTGDEIMLTTEIAARFIGRSDRQIRTWKSQKGCPVPDGGITTPEHIAAIFEWWGEQRFREGRREADAVLDAEGGMSTDQIERKTAMVKLQLEEIKLGEKKGHLLPKGPYIHVLSMLLGDIGSLIRAQSSQMSSQLAAVKDVREIRRLVDKYNEKVLKKLSVGEAMNIDRIDAADEDDRFIEDGDEG